MISISKGTAIVTIRAPFSGLIQLRQLFVATDHAHVSALSVVSQMAYVTNGAQVLDEQYPDDEDLLTTPN
jgi:hypothetical protein